MKSKLINGIITAIIGAFFIIMLHSCAQQQSSISGGDKDTIPPSLKKSSPELLSGNFDGKVVKIKFDEYFTLDNIEQKFLMTPPYESEKPKIKTKGKWVLVKFKEKLKPDTTYTLQFFNAVKDFNEGNPIPDYKFVFSTGPTIDTLGIEGKVVDSETLEKEVDMLVMLYDKNHPAGDSAFIKYKPNYITRTDTAGRFKFTNIRQGEYRLFALKDINETQRFDLENEKVAFMDATIVPEAHQYHRVDSLAAGTILHKGAKGHRYLDTLLTDTVIIQDITYCTPNNITLFTFEEKHLVQYIAERNRDIRQRIKLVFNKPVDQDTVLITYVDDTLRSPDMVYDFNYFRDTLNVWLRDTADINNDTLQIRVTFATLDSLQNPTTETDTLNVKFAKKKKAVGKDDKSKSKTAQAASPIDSLNFKLKTNFSGDFDMQKPIKLDIPIIFSQFDSSLLHVYECVDTTFEEDMNQKILKNQRLDSALYRLVFKRPVYGDVVWYPTDTIVGKDWYRATYSTNRDTVMLEVLDSAMIHKSKFSNMLKYRNEYYLDEIQKIRDSINTVIIDQKKISYSRPSRDTISLILEKAPTRGMEVSAINIDKMSEGGMEVLQDDFRISIVLRDSLAIKKDTLAIKVQAFDRYIHNRAHKVVERTFKDTLFAIYKIKYQKLLKKDLVSPDTMRFVFERKIQEMPQLTLCDYPDKGSSWYDSEICPSMDTLTVHSIDADYLDLDTIRYTITYQTLDKDERTIYQTDSLIFVRPQEATDAPQQKTERRRRSDMGKEGQQAQAEAKKNMAKASLKIPVEFQMTTDSMDTKCRYISFESEPGKQYMLEVDDSTFTSIYDTPNLYLSSKGKIRMPDYYGEFTIDIQNIGYLEHYPDIDEDIDPFEDIDTSRTLRRRINPKDTMEVQYSSIAEGQALICLCGPKGEIKYKQAIKADSVVKFDFVVPAEYMVKIIYDRNMNGKWDTGKYIEQSYPERTIQFPKKQTVKSKWNTEAVWRL